MRVAVVGMGLAGLGVSYHLVKRGHRVTLFDEKGIGGGASGIASGLLDPYPGRLGVRGAFADEAILCTLEMIDAAEKTLGKKVALRTGIVHKEWKSPPPYPDVKEIGKGEILVTSGVTLLMKEYLEGVFCSLKGCEWIQKRVSFDEPFEGFDRVVFASGFGCHALGLSLPLQYVKGQILTYEADREYQRSEMAKMYLAPLGKDKVQIGSTYEHQFKDVLPDKERALFYLKEKMAYYFPEYIDKEPLACHAGVRVMQKGSFQPLIQKCCEKRYLFTGLGSRGILYHALYGRHLADLLQ